MKVTKKENVAENAYCMFCRGSAMGLPHRAVCAVPVVTAQAVALSCACVCVCSTIHTTVNSVFRICRRGIVTPNGEVYDKI